MKKLFMSLAAVLALSASAETVTLTPQTLDYDNETKSGVVTTGNANFEIIVKRSESSTDPTINAKDKDLRVYAKGSLTIGAIAGIEISEVVFNLSSQGKKRLTEITANTGTIATQASGDETVTWTGKSDAITFTVGDKAKYGSDGASKAGQFDITDMVVTYSVNAIDPNTVLAPVIKYDIESNSVTLECATEGASIYYTTDGSTPDTNSILYTAPFNPTESCTVNAIAIKGENKSNVATLEIAVPAKANSIAEMLSNVSKSGDIVFVNCDLTIVYANGSNVFVVDTSNNSTLLYANNTYTTGDIIPGGWVAVYSPYNDLPEFKPFSSFPEATSKTDITYPVLTSVSLTDVNKVGYLSSVTFETNTPESRDAFTGILEDGTEITFYNSFKLSSIKAGTYKVLVAVQIRSGAPQVFPIEYAEVADEEPTPLYVVGANVNGNGWAPDAESARMTYLGNGIYEWKGEILASDFKFCNGSWAVSYGGNETALQLDEEYTVYDNGGNIAISDFVGYILTNPVVIFDYNNLVIKVSGTKTATELTWYVAGDFNNWTLNEDAQMTKKENGEYELALITISEGKTEGGFKVATTGWGNQYGITGVTNENLSVVLESVSGEYGNAPYILEEGTYSVTWNPATATVTFKVLTLTGVEGIDADDAEAVYYNLQGVKVVNPTNGIYVKVAGGKAVKTVVAE